MSTPSINNSLRGSCGTEIEVLATAPAAQLEQSNPKVDQITSEAFKANMMTIQASMEEHGFVETHAKVDPSRRGILIGALLEASSTNQVEKGIADEILSYAKTDEEVFIDENLEKSKQTVEEFEDALDESFSCSTPLRSFKLKKASKHIKDSEIVFSIDTKEALIKRRKMQLILSIASTTFRALLSPAAAIFHPLHMVKKRLRKNEAGIANTKFNALRSSVSNLRQLVKGKRNSLYENLNLILLDPVDLRSFKSGVETDENKKIVDDLTKMWRLLNLEDKENKKEKMINFIKSFIITKLDKINREREINGQGRYFLSDRYGRDDLSTPQIFNQLAAKIQINVQNLCTEEDNLAPKLTELRVSSWFRRVGSKAEKLFSLDGVKAAFAESMLIIQDLENVKSDSFAFEPRLFSASDLEDNYFTTIAPIEDKLNFYKATFRSEFGSDSLLTRFIS